MFSPLGSPEDNIKEIDWLGDLKFFIDNDNQMLSQYFFPVVKHHSRNIEDPKAYKLYFKPITTALKTYCEKFEIDDIGEKFPKESLIELAKQICEEQKKHIENGDYDEIT